MSIIETNPVVIGNVNLDTTAGDIGGAWVAFTPAYANLTIGAGTNTGFVGQVGKNVFARTFFSFAADSAVTGDIGLTLPVTSATYGGSTPIGFVRITVSGATITGIIVRTSTTLGVIRVFDTSGTYAQSVACSSTIPGTWITGSQIEIQFNYEAA